MKANPICKVCKTELNNDNWYVSHRKSNHHLCKGCSNKRKSVWQKANPEKCREAMIRFGRKKGVRPFSENKECALFLGVHVAERVLSHVFKDVKRMPHGNPGFDVICNRDMRIDIKSACFIGKHPHWMFNITRNTTADYFLCLAFDNRKDLTPLHAWLIPGSKLNHLTGTSISPSTINKWDAYRIDISKISECCNQMKHF